MPDPEPATTQDQTNAPAPTPAATTQTPAAAPPAQPATPAVNPPKDQPVAMDDTLDFNDPVTGQPSQVSVGELLKDRQQLAELGDTSGLKDMMGFLQGDPDAQKKILQAQIDQLTPPQQPDAKDEYIQALEGRLKTVEERMGRADRFADNAEEAEDRQYVTSLLAIPQVKDNFPALAAKPEIMAPMLQQQFTKWRRVAKQQGVDLTQRNDLVVRLLQTFEQAVSGIVTAYGGTIQSGEAQPPSGQPQPPHIPGQPLRIVPQAGGTPAGSPPMPGQAQAPTGPLSREQMLERIKLQRQARA